MAINLPSGFSILNIDPIDSRFVVADQSERLGFSSANVYEGLVVYQKDNDKLYVLTDTSSYNSTGGWTEVGASIPTDVSALNTFTGSIQGQVNSLMDSTSSYALISDISGAFASDSASIGTRLTSLEAVSGGSIFAQTGSVWSTTNNLEITGSFTVTDGIFKLVEMTSTPTAEAGGIFYSASAFYFGIE